MDIKYSFTEYNAHYDGLFTVQPSGLIRGSFCFEVYAKDMKSGECSSAGIRLNKSQMVDLVKTLNHLIEEY